MTEEKLWIVRGEDPAGDWQAFGFPTKKAQMEMVKELDKEGWNYEFSLSPVKVPQ